MADLGRDLRSDHAAAETPTAGSAAVLRRLEDGRWISTAIATPQLPPQDEAWRRGLAALDQEARDRHDAPFHELSPEQQDGLLGRMQRGELDGEAWGGMPCKMFFEHRVIPDITHAYYAHPVAWNEIGFGGPASPRGYVRMQLDRRDPWEAAEAYPGEERGSDGRTHMSADPFGAPRAAKGRAPDVLRRGGWLAMREFDDQEVVDFVVVGTGAGGAPLIAGLAEAGFSVIGFDAGPYFRPLEDFASDESEQSKLYWTDQRVVDGANPITMGGKNSGKAVGGSTVHFAMVSLRFRPEWFKSRSALGYGADWPLDWREMWRYYAKAEKALSISGPIRYPWGPPRPRYPYRAHELNGAAELLARGAEAMGIRWTPTPLATVSAPHGQSPPCVYRGFCRFGCSTNAKQSQLVTFIPKALAAGAEIRDLAMVGRIEMGPNGRATGVHYHRDGRWRFQKARNVVVAGYAIETPRLLLASATDRYPDGLANGSGPRRQEPDDAINQAVFGLMEQEVRWYKGPPSLAITEHWNYEDRKDFFGGYCWMAQGPLPVEWATIQTSARGLWGQALRDEMEKYNHQVGLKMVGEMLPDENNRVTLADDKDQYGLRVARVTYRWGDNDKALIAHALGQMQESLEAVGATDVFRQVDDTNHLAGTARMGDDPRTSVVNADCRSWDIPNLWVCDGSIFPTAGGVNPSLTITSIAMRTADRIKALAARGEL